MDEDIQRWVDEASFTVSHWNKSEAHPHVEPLAEARSRQDLRLALVLLVGGRGGVFSATFTRPSCNMDREWKGSRGAPRKEYQSGTANVLFENVSQQQQGESPLARQRRLRKVTCTFSELTSELRGRVARRPDVHQRKQPPPKKKKLFVTVPDDRRRLVHACARSAQLVRGGGYFFASPMSRIYITPWSCKLLDLEGRCSLRFPQPRQVCSTYATHLTMQKGAEHCYTCFSFLFVFSCFLLYL